MRPFRDTGRVVVPQPELILALGLFESGPPPEPRPAPLSFQQSQDQINRWTQSFMHEFLSTVDFRDRWYYEGGADWEKDYESVDWEGIRETMELIDEEGPSVVVPYREWRDS